MFESAELGRSLSKSEFKSIVPKLRSDLLEAQFAMETTNSPVIIIIEGVNNAVKGEVVNRLNEWFDTRGLEVYAFGKKSEEEAERPKFWRYWKSLPARGRISLFSGSWYTGSLMQTALKELDSSKFDEHMNRINGFERMLADDGAIILKFWLHMSKKYQQQSFKAFKDSDEYRFKISEADLLLHKNHSDYTGAAKRAVKLTDELHAPWVVVEAEDENYRDITVANTILSALKQRLQRKEDSGTPDGESILVQPQEVGEQTNVLDQVDISKDISKSRYNKDLKRYQKELNELSWEAFHKNKSIVLVFEGWDAAGKGGVIRRISQAIDARVSRVISIAAPTDEELSHHYLWRFWRHIPKAGNTTIYDRSWYGRVLVERVEGFASDSEWRRSFSEINDFEEQLTDSGKGISLCKFWIHIDKDEQLARFKEREITPYKQHKITDEDWRNRLRWDDYELAVNDMVTKTSTDHAPWTLIPGNSKKYARIQVLKTICKALKKALNTDD